MLGTRAHQGYCTFGGGTLLGKPALAYAHNTNQYFVVWHEMWSNRVDIAGMVLSGAGVPSFVYTTISADPGLNPRYNPDVAYNPSRNEFLVVWEQWNDSAGEDDIYARRVSGDAIPLQPEAIEIVTGGVGDGHQRKPAVANIPTQTHQGHYLVVWEDHWKFDDIDIWARRVNGDGSTPDPKFPISVVEEDQYSPSVAGKETDGNYLVVWSHEEPGWMNTFIHGREVSMDNGFAGDEMPMGGFTAGSPAVVSGSSGFLTVFDDILPLSTNPGIFGQRWGNHAIYLPLVRRSG